MIGTNKSIQQTSYT